MSSLERALGHRSRMDENWMKKPFEALVRSHWVAFRDYFLAGSEA